MILPSLALAAVLASAQEPAAVPEPAPAAAEPAAAAAEPAAAAAEPVASVAPAAEAPQATAPKISTKSDQSEKADDSQPAAAPAPAAAAEAPAEKPRGGAQDELDFLLKRARADSDAQKAAAVDLRVFADAHAGGELAPRALAELAALQDKLNDSAALVTRLELVYEFPSAPEARDAREAFLKGAARRLPKRLKDEAARAARGSEAKDAPGRLADLLETLSGPLGDELYFPALDAAARFSRRFPDYAGGDRADLALGRLRERVQDWPASLLAYDRLLTLYPSSRLRPQALWGKGAVLADRVKDYRGAAAAFTELADRYQDAAQAPQALERAGQLLADKLKMYEPAVDAYRKLSTRYPGTEAARRALQEEAKLERKKLGNPARAAQTLETLAQQFATHPEAPEALYEAGQIYEDDLQDNAKAIAEYQSLASKFPDHKLGRKAAERAAKLGAAH